MQPGNLRRRNLARIFALIGSATEPVSRADLASASGLTKPTVSKLVDELVKGGLAVEGEAVSGATGRPKIPLALGNYACFGIGLEIMWKRVRAVAVGLNGNVIARDEFGLDVPNSDYREVVRESALLVRRLREKAEAECSAHGVGPTRFLGMCVSIPGRRSMDPESILSAPILQWFDVPFLRDLRLELGANEPIPAFNDNQLAVLYEVEQHPGESFLFVSAATGIGGAVVLDGEVYGGMNGWAGEIGHTVVDRHGPLCRCGRSGCIEAYLSRRALQERAGVSKSAHITEAISVLFKRPDADDVAAELGELLGIALSNALNVIDVNKVVLAGYLVDLLPHIEDSLYETLRGRALIHEVDEVAIESSQAPSEASVLGAGRLTLRPVFDDPGKWL